MSETFDVQGSGSLLPIPYGGSFVEPAYHDQNDTNTETVAGIEENPPSILEYKYIQSQLEALQKRGQRNAEAIIQKCIEKFDFNIITNRIQEVTTRVLELIKKYENYQRPLAQNPKGEQNFKEPLEKEHYLITTEYKYLVDYIRNWKVPILESLSTSHQKREALWGQEFSQNTAAAKNPGEALNIFRHTYQEIPEEKVIDPIHITGLEHAVQTWLLEQPHPDNIQALNKASRELYEAQLNNLIRTSRTKVVEDTIVAYKINLAPDTRRIRKEIGDLVSAHYRPNDTPPIIQIGALNVSLENAAEEISVDDFMDQLNETFQQQWSDPLWDVEHALTEAQRTIDNNEYYELLLDRIDKVKQQITESAELTQGHKDSLARTENQKSNQPPYTTVFTRNDGIVRFHSTYDEHCTLTDEERDALEIEIAILLESIDPNEDIVSELEKLREARISEYIKQKRLEILRKKVEVFEDKMRIDEPIDRVQELLTEKSQYEYFTDPSSVPNLKGLNADAVKKKQKSARDKFEKGFNTRKLIFTPEFSAFLSENVEDISRAENHFITLHSELAQTMRNDVLVNDFDHDASVDIQALQKQLRIYHESTLYSPIIEEYRNYIRNTNPNDLKTSHNGEAVKDTWRDAEGNTQSKAVLESAAKREMEKNFEDCWKKGNPLQLHILLEELQRECEEKELTASSAYRLVLTSIEATPVNRSLPEITDNWKAAQRAVFALEVRIKELQKYAKLLPIPNNHEPRITSDRKLVYTEVLDSTLNTERLKALLNDPMAIDEVITLIDGAPSPLGEIASTLQWVQHTLTNPMLATPNYRQVPKTELNTYVGSAGVDAVLTNLKKLLSDEIKKAVPKNTTNDCPLLTLNKQDSDKDLRGFYTLAIAYLEKKRSEYETTFLENYCDIFATPHPADKAYQQNLRDQCGAIYDAMNSCYQEKHANDHEKAERLRTIVNEAYYAANKSTKTKFSIMQKGPDAKAEDDHSVVVAVGNDRVINYGEITRRAIVRFISDTAKQPPFATVFERDNRIPPWIPTDMKSRLSDEDLAQINMVLREDHSRKHPNEITDFELGRVEATQTALERHIASKSVKITEKFTKLENLYRTTYPTLYYQAQICNNTLQDIVHELQVSGYELEANLGDILEIKQTTSPSIEILREKIKVFNLKEISTITIQTLLDKILSASEKFMDFLLPTSAEPRQASGLLVRREKPTYGDLVVQITDVLGEPQAPHYLGNRFLLNPMPDAPFALPAMPQSATSIQQAYNILIDFNPLYTAESDTQRLRVVLLDTIDTQQLRNKTVTELVETDPLNPERLPTIMRVALYRKLISEPLYEKLENSWSALTQKFGNMFRRN